MAIQKIIAPVGASTNVISLLAEHSLQLDFDTNNTTVERTDNDLTINFTDGGTVILDDFFVTKGSELPMFVLPGGVEISSAELLQNLNPDLDLTTAAGPAASRAEGSGAGEYGDGAGDLLGGLDRLGSLGTFQWGRETGDSGADIMSLSALDTGIQPIIPGLGGLPEEGPNEPPDEVPEETPSLIPVEDLGYMARAVVYASAEQENNSAVFRLLDEHGNPISDLSAVNYSIQGVENDYFALPPVVNADGSLVLNLSDAGFQALQSAGGNVYDLVTVVVDGKSYLMQIVVSPDGEFNSADEDVLLAAQNIAGETMYEWHRELGGVSTAGDRVAAQNANTEFIFSQDPNGAVGTGGTKFQHFSGSFISGEGDDYVNLTAAGSGGNLGGLQNGAEIHTGAGADTVIFSTQHGMGGAIINTGQDAGDSVTIRVEQNRLGRAMDARNDRGDNDIISTDVNLLHTNGSYDGLTGTVIYSSGSAANNRTNRIDAAHNSHIEYAKTEGSQDVVYGTSSDKMVGGFLLESDGNSSNIVESGNDTELKLVQDFRVSANYGVGHSRVNLSGISIKGKNGVNEITSGNDTTYSADIHTVLSHNGQGGLTLGTDFLRVTGNYSDDGQRSINTISSGNDTVVEVSNKFEIAWSILPTLPGTAVISIINNIMSSNGFGDNSIESGNDTNIVGIFENIFDRDLRNPHEAQSSFFSSGMHAGMWGSGNRIDSGRDTNLTIHHINYEENTVASLAYGMRAQHSGSTNMPGREVGNSITSGGKTTIDVIAGGIAGATEDHARGLFAVVQEPVTVGTSGASLAQNTITSNGIEINVKSNTGNAFGMDAGYGGENILQSHDQAALSLVITAAGAKDSYSLYASEGVNRIIGHSQVGRPDAIGDEVHLMGDLFATGNDGLNSIVTGAGNDMVTIEGGITTKNGAVTAITTGAGDDIIHIHGKIEGALTIDMGEGGSDVLILTAPTTADFKEWYGGWLESLDAETLETMHIESIKFEGMADWEVFVEGYPEVEAFVNLADRFGITVELGEQALKPTIADTSVDSDASVDSGASVLAGSDSADASLCSFADLDNDLTLFGEGVCDRLAFNTENSFNITEANGANVVFSSEFEGLIVDLLNTAEEDSLLSAFLDSPASDENNGDSAVFVGAAAENSFPAMDAEFITEFATGFTYDAWGGSEAEGVFLPAQQEILSTTGN